MVLCGISTPFGVLFPCLGKVAHALLTRPPLKQLIASYSLSPLDLHVLGTPPAFVLSQDQTLMFNSCYAPDFLWLAFSLNSLTACVLAFLCSVSFSRFVALKRACLYYHSSEFVSTPFFNFFDSFLSRIFSPFIQWDSADERGVNSLFPCCFPSRFMVY